MNDPFCCIIFHIDSQTNAVDKIDKTTVIYDGDSAPAALHYKEMVAPLTKAVQELSAKIGKMQPEINKLKEG